MPIGFRPFITRRFVKNHPNSIFVFGDNVERVGLGGQAGAMRGEPNAIGVPTKYKPTMEYNAFFRCDFSDEAEALFDGYMKEDFDKIEEHLKNGVVVIFPTDGIGTGLSKLPEYAPWLVRYIESHVEWLLTRYGDCTECYIHPDGGVYNKIHEDATTLMKDPSTNEWLPSIMYKPYYYGEYYNKHKNCVYTTTVERFNERFTLIKEKVNV